jgi:hypothetical protein
LARLMKPALHVNLSMNGPALEDTGKLWQDKSCVRP